MGGAGDLPAFRAMLAILVLDRQNTSSKKERNKKKGTTRDLKDKRMMVEENGVRNA